MGSQLHHVAAALGAVPNWYVTPFTLICLFRGVRSQAHGISAAAGKAGALFATILFSFGDGMNRVSFLLHRFLRLSDC